jgi:hypothetical protein
MAYTVTNYRTKKALKDRFDPMPHQPAAGQLVYVTAAWGPFRGFTWTSPDGQTHHSSCGRASLVSCRDAQVLP